MLNSKTLSLLLEDTRHTVRHPKKKQGIGVWVPSALLTAIGRRSLWVRFPWPTKMLPYWGSVKFMDLNSFSAGIH